MVALSSKRLWDCHKKWNRYQTSYPPKFFNFISPIHPLLTFTSNFRWQVASDILSPARTILIYLCKIMEKVTAEVAKLAVDESAADRKLLIAVDFGTTYSGVAWAQTRRVCTPRD